MASLLRRRGGNDNKCGLLAGPADVLLGRGKGAYEWQGNLRYQQIIGYSLHAYTAAKRKQEKTKISNSIVAAVKHSGGRFLRENRDGTLTEATDKEAREKVAHALRHKRRLCQGEKGPMDFTMGMFGGNSQSGKISSFCQNDLDHSAFWSNRTDETEPVTSTRSDRTDNLEHADSPTSHGFISDIRYDIDAKPQDVHSDISIGNNMSFDQDIGSLNLVENSIQFQKAAAVSQSHSFPHEDNIPRVVSAAGIGSFQTVGGELRRHSLQSDDMDDSSFDAEVEAVTDNTLNDMEDCSFLDMGSLQSSLPTL